MGKPYLSIDWHTRTRGLYHEVSRSLLPVKCYLVVDAAQDWSPDSSQRLPSWTMIWKTRRPLIRLTCQLQIQNVCAIRSRRCHRAGCQWSCPSLLPKLVLTKEILEHDREVPSTDGDAEASSSLDLISIWCLSWGDSQVCVVTEYKPGDKIQTHEQW